MTTQQMYVTIVRELGARYRAALKAAHAGKISSNDALLAGQRYRAALKAKTIAFNNLELPFNV